MGTSSVWSVRFTAAAHQHIRQIVRYLLDKEGPAFARRFADGLRETTAQRLEAFPLQGRIVPELETLTKEFRELQFQSYRIIYRAVPHTRTVRVLLVAYHKRNLEDLLLKTMLGD